MKAEDVKAKRWEVCDGCGFETLTICVGHVRKPAAGSGCPCPVCTEKRGPEIVKQHYCDTCYEVELEIATRGKKLVMHRRSARDEFTRDFIRDFNEACGAAPDIGGPGEIWINEDRYREVKQGDIISKMIDADPVKNPSFPPFPDADALSYWNKYYARDRGFREAPPEPRGELPRSSEDRWYLRCPDVHCPSAGVVVFCLARSEPRLECSCCGERLRLS